MKNMTVILITTKIYWQNPYTETYRGDLHYSELRYKNIK